MRTPRVGCAQGDDCEKWSKLWTAWALAFAVAETIAVRSHDPHAPLSHQLRRVLGVRHQPLQRRLGQVAFASFAGWLALHLYREQVAGEPTAHPAEKPPCKK